MVNRLSVKVSAPRISGCLSGRWGASIVLERRMVGRFTRAFDRDWRYNFYF